MKKRQALKIMQLVNSNRWLRWKMRTAFESQFVAFRWINGRSYFHKVGMRR